MFVVCMLTHIQTNHHYYEFPAPAVCNDKAGARSCSEAIRPAYIEYEIGFALVEYVHTSVSL